MQYVDSVVELRHVEDAIFPVRMNSNLNDSSTDDRHLFPIASGTAGLNHAQLITGFTTGRRREPPQAIATISEPLKWFH